MTTATTEIYLSANRYRVLVSHLTGIMRRYKRSLFNHRPADDADGLKMRLLAALRINGLDMGELVLRAPRIEGSKRQALIDALADLEPDAFSGAYEPDQIKLTLGEKGDIWPDYLLEEVAA
jgi:hypothetical protein